ncbi:transcription elongation factor NusA [Mesotoga sp. HF07.pep.5.2.highcov]|jgi:N utilization substance protein A|uniref:transcription termination factor NusA n=1 Tax=unclassified Mesotoga TaxID=1184398 RepID=UPI000EF13ABE|nr:MULTISPECIES: transcription termination factor NusA [unclassified Mesotoga]MDK2943757.1 transcription termination/antitermination protein NusA [Mesotoga sp.]RLL88226.1 transcription elongation factor NusA [Mesotoga sp. H07pep.5.4]RLL90552.1 transcription elongation factor NusA [Mesotoga sp. HF07.pep.5.2.highcov]
MNLNLLEALDQLQDEKNIEKEEVIDILEKALQSAYKKNFASESDVDVRIDRLTGDIEVFERLLVVEAVENPSLEVKLEEALKFDSSAEIGSTVERKLNIKKFKRIAAQTARQVLIQKIREKEKENLFDKYVDMKGTVTTSEVLRVTDEWIDLRIGKLETRIPTKELIPGEQPRLNSLMKVYVVDVTKSVRGPRLLVTRRTPDFVIELLKLQVPEIASGDVTVKAIAREEGIRTKVAVFSQNTKVDPVGACIGESGTRIAEVLREIKPEKVDILRWSDNPAELVGNSIAPASALEVKVANIENREATVFVSPTQLSLAIGKGGQNARLAAKLTGWKIDIKPIM